MFQLVKLEEAAWGESEVSPKATGVWVAQRPDWHASSRNKEGSGTADSETVLLLGSLDKIDSKKMGRSVDQERGFFFNNLFLLE